MIISDLEHIEVVSQETKDTQVIGGYSFAGAKASSGARATGSNTFTDAQSGTFTNTGSFTFYPPYN